MDENVISNVQKPEYMDLPKKLDPMLIVNDAYLDFKKGEDFNEKLLLRYDFLTKRILINVSFGLKDILLNLQINCK